MLLKDSKTKINLMRAFAGESQARNRYDMAACTAKSEGLIIVEKVFKYTSWQEQAHATVFYNFLKEFNDSNITIDADYPINVYSSTLDHLNAAMCNEYAEYEDIYKTFGNIAKEEGFEKISTAFFKIAEIEKTHGNRFKSYYNDLKNNTLFKREVETEWLCTNCGHIHKGISAPLVCPVCSHPQGYFISQDKIVAL